MWISFENVCKLDQNALIIYMLYPKTLQNATSPEIALGHMLQYMRPRAAVKGRD